MTRQERRRKEWLEWMKALAIVLVISVLVRGFLFGTVQVKGTSMEPSFHHQDLVGVNKLSYRLQEPQMGDVVVCSYTRSTGEENIIKRVIGVPGDVIDMVQLEDLSYGVSVNGQLLEEPYLNGTMNQKGDQTYPYTVPEGCYFVMGDNRDQSNDSRFLSIGVIEQGDMMGKVVIRLWPFSDFGLIP